jgi:RHS repeat-associated protein
MINSYTYKAKVRKYNTSEEILTVYEYNSKNQLVKEVSPVGAVTLYTYDANGNVTKVTDAEGYETVSSYDAVNNLINVTKPDGSQIHYSYDALNRITEIIDGEGNRTQYSYDCNGNIISETDPMGNITSYSYDALNRLISVTNALGHTTSYTYRYDGKVETSTDAMNNLYINEYDAAGQLVKEILPNNYTTSYTYDLLGRVSSVTDAMGNVTRYTYDFDDRLIKVIDALGYERTTSYTKDGQVSSVTDGNGNKTSYEYNLLGKLTKTIDGLGNEVDYTYDPVGNLIEIRQYKGITEATLSLMSDASSYTTELDEVIIKHEYNSNGQLTKEINPSGTTVNYVYDKNGNLISKEDEDGYVTNYTYDSVNNLTSIIYDSGKTVSYTYNPNNQITSMTDWLGTNTYDLDVLGRINTVTDYEGRITGYTWNSRDQKLSMTYFDGSEVKYCYDIKGNLLKVIDGNGKETSYTYDALDRMVSEVLPNGVKTSRTYDALSRIISETSTRKDGSIIYSNSFTYDAEGNILSENKKVNENGNKLTSYTAEYLYDSNNQLVQVKDSEGILEKYFYDTLGNRIQKEKTVPGNGNGNGKNKNNNKSSTDITKYTYNNENQMITLQGKDEEVAGHYTNGELVIFTYDKRGNVRSITTNSGTIGQYYYDDTNKMAYSVNKMGIKSAYTYDGAGRRVKEALEHSNINVPEKASLHVQTPIEELLDSNQNIALDVKKEINYVIDSTSLDNKVLMVYGMHTKTQRYTYGNGVIGLDSWNDMAETWESINQQKHDEQLYYVKDFRGSVLALTDSKCKVDTYYDYDVFGIPSEKNHVNDQGIRSNIYHYAGYIYDYTTSLYFVNARYYMPETGRFMAKDIYRGDGLNRYAYVRNNPLVYVDPTGLCGEGAQGKTYPGSITLAELLKENPSLNHPNWDEQQKYFCIWLYCTHSADEILKLENSSYVLLSIKQRGIDASKLTVADMDKLYNDVNGTAYKIRTVITFAAMAYSMYKAGSTAQGTSKTVFPEDPKTFNPDSLVRKEYNNGKIIKWHDPKTGKAVYEWNADPKYGNHYHVTPDGKNRIPHPDTGNTHIRPGESVPKINK